MSNRAGRTRPPTITDVAALAGLSTAVVSYVVNDGPRGVAPDTQARVLAAIDELGYRPNRAAQALATNRSRTIGLIVPDTTNAFFSDLVGAIERRCRAEGLITLIGNSDYDSECERSYVEAFEDYGADGVIIVAADATKPWAADVSTPLVFLHRRPDGAAGPIVRADDHLGAVLATEHLLQLDRGPVHCIAGPEDWGPIRARVDAWREVQRSQLGLTADEAMLVRVRYPRADAGRDLRQWLERISGPTSVFVTTDEQAIGLLFAAAAIGLRIPEDLAVVSFDDTSAAACCVPPLTAVRIDLDRMAALAVDQLLQRPADGDADTIAVSLVIRASSGVTPS